MQTPGMLNPLPSYDFPDDRPSLWAMLRRGVSDFASVVPRAILDEPAIQMPGPGAPLVISDPDLAREVLNDRSGRFGRDALVRRLFRRAWGGGIAGAEGEDWRRQRQAVTPALRPQAVDDYCAAFSAIAHSALATWPVDAPADLGRQAARIIAEVVFSVLIDGKGTVDTPAVAADMSDYVHRISGFDLLDLAPMPEAWHDHVRGVGRDPAVGRIRRLARDLASRRDDKSHDLIGRLEGVGPLEDNIRGLIPAAMDTTVAALGWVLYVLALQPEWQSRVAAEGETVGAHGRLESLPVTRRVVQEVLRLYPPAPLLVRSAVVNGEIGGFPFRRGQTISISVYAMHRHRRHWAAPDEFDPDRFLTGGGHAQAWMPFGAGPRTCLASQFAIAELAVIAARLIAGLELSPLGPPPSLTLQVTTKAVGGLHVRSRLRHGAVLPA